MPLTHDTAYTVNDIYNEVATNLYDTRLRWFTDVDILNSLQDQYNKVVALLSPIEKAAIIPQVASPYYPIRDSIADYMYFSAAYNVTTNRWLTSLPYSRMKAYNFIGIHGNSQCFNVVDLRRIMVWPHNSIASGVFLLIYKAIAPTITLAHTPLLPYSIGARLLEFMATADLLEQAREFVKASKWWEKVYTAVPGQKSLMDQAAAEIKNIARSDRDTVLEPYRWLMHTGTGDLSDVTWISNETPAGTVDGDNAVFTLAAAPSPVASLILTKNGVVLYEGTGYSLSGSTITFATGYVPVPPVGLDTIGDLIRAWYQIA